MQKFNIKSYSELNNILSEMNLTKKQIPIVIK